MPTPAANPSLYFKGVLFDYLVERVTKTAVSPDAMGGHPMTVPTTSLILNI